MNKEICMNILAVMDKTGKPSIDTLRMLNIYGSVEKLHDKFIEWMRENEWSAGGHATNESIRMTPHIRRWSLLVDEQRLPLLAMETLSVDDLIDNDDTGDSNG